MSPSAPKKQKRNKRFQISLACVFCRRSHMSCDDARPCKRCIGRGIADRCSDEPTARRISLKRDQEVEDGHGTAPDAIATPSLVRPHDPVRSKGKRRRRREPDQTDPAPPERVPTSRASTRSSSIVAQHQDQPSPAPSLDLSGEQIFEQQLYFGQAAWDAPTSGADSRTCSAASPARDSFGGEELLREGQEQRLSDQGYLDWDGFASFLDAASTPVPLQAFPTIASSSQFSSDMDAPPISSRLFCSESSVPLFDDFIPSKLADTFRLEPTQLSFFDFPLPPESLSSYASSSSSSSLALLPASSPVAPDTRFLSGPVAALDLHHEYHLPHQQQLSWDFGPGWSRLEDLIRDFSPYSQSILRAPMESFRIDVAAVVNSLTVAQTMQQEETVRALLLKYDRVFTVCHTPSAIWRMSGELIKANTEFADLMDTDASRFRNGELSIYDLMTEHSATNLLINWLSMALDPTRKAVLTSAQLVRPPALSWRPASSSKPRGPSGAVVVSCSFGFTVIRDAVGLPACICGCFLSI